MNASDTRKPAERVVVGVDGSPSSLSALRWAVRHAAATGAEVEAVYAWEYPVAFGEPLALLPGENLAAAAGTAFASVIEKAATGSPRVEVRHRVELGNPVTVLLARAERADLLVVGWRGYGGFDKALLGSVSQHCIRHASCPVVVVRGEQ
ncbi:universal stress protein [Glycomyces albidus]|uniref:Universal stress protein n=1 Tax=Glycomyces albidus TaxID=2656774 RepID=A0A6L5G958_9ACTN|nr:universal stress protein [Glycomyces albidus]MQM26185.1 universal stress protein [Glycomyces albidus]